MQNRSSTSAIPGNKLSVVFIGDCDYYGIEEGRRDELTKRVTIEGRDVVVSFFPITKEKPLSNLETSFKRSILDSGIENGAVVYLGSMSMGESPAILGDCIDSVRKIMGDKIGHELGYNVMPNCVTMRKMLELKLAKNKTMVGSYDEIAKWRSSFADAYYSRLIDVHEVYRHNQPDPFKGMAKKESQVKFSELFLSDIEYVFKRLQVPVNKRFEDVDFEKHRRFKPEDYAHIRETQDKGMPDDVTFVKSNDEPVSFTCDGYTFKTTIGEIRAGKFLGGGAEGQVYLSNVVGVKDGDETGRKEMEVVVKIKVIRPGHAGFRSIYNEVALGKLKTFDDDDEDLKQGTTLLADFRDETNLYIIFKNDGITLETFSKLVHKRYNHWPAFAIVRLIYVLSDRLKDLHRNYKLAYLDLKPSNVLIKDGDIKICDYGVSKCLNPIDDSRSDLPGAGTVVFAAPETLKYPRDERGLVKAEVAETLTFDTLNETRTSFEMVLPRFEFLEQADVYRVFLGF